MRSEALDVLLPFLALALLCIIFIIAVYVLISAIQACIDAWFLRSDTGRIAGDLCDYLNSL